MKRTRFSTPRALLSGNAQRLMHAFIITVLASFHLVSAEAAGLVETLAKVKPSVVGIGTFQPTRRPPGKLLATGFVVGDGSYVVTNYHVAGIELDSERFETLAVFVGRGKKAKIATAKIVKYSKEHDLAILKIAVNLDPVVLGGRSLLPEGSEIAFTGFPLGVALGLYPVTNKGIVSSITPIAIPSSSSQELNAAKINRLRNPVEIYQLDAIAYPGNSGSPLYRVDNGEVVGIINMVHVKETKEDILSKPSAISYAIPVRHLHELMKGLP